MFRNAKQRLQILFGFRELQLSRLHHWKIFQKQFGYKFWGSQHCSDCDGRTSPRLQTRGPRELLHSRRSIQITSRACILPQNAWCKWRIVQSILWVESYTTKRRVHQHILLVPNMCPIACTTRSSEKNQQKLPKLWSVVGTNGHLSWKLLPMELNWCPYEPTIVPFQIFFPWRWLDCFCDNYKFYFRR